MHNYAPVTSVRFYESHLKNLCVNYACFANPRSVLDKNKHTITPTEHLAAFVISKNACYSTYVQKHIDLIISC